MVSYEISVFTGKTTGAGTDANVFLVIHGEERSSGEKWNSFD